MKMFKVVNREHGFKSAWWGFEELPGVLLFDNRIANSESIKNNGWQYHVSSSTQADILSRAILLRLESQIFPSRREALQALQVALDMDNHE